MKNIILLVLMVFGTIAQAQEFDFSCEPEGPIESTWTVKTDMGIGKKGRHDRDITVTEGIFEYSYKIAIPSGYKGSGIEDGFNGIVASGEEDDDVLLVEIVLDENFNFSDPPVIIPIDIKEAVVESEQRLMHVFVDIDGYNNLEAEFNIIEDDLSTHNPIVEFNVPPGLVITGSTGIVEGTTDEIGWRINPINPGDTRFFVYMVIKDGFDFEANDFVVNIEGLEHILSPAPSVVFKAILVMDEFTNISKAHAFVQGESKVGNIVIKLPDHIAIIQDHVGVDGGFFYEKYSYTVDPLNIGDREVKITVTAKDGFDYNQADISLAFTNFKSGYFGLNIGNLAELSNINLDELPTHVGTNTWVSNLIYRISPTWTNKPEANVLTAGTIVHRIGGSTTHEFHGISLGTPQHLNTNSSDDKFEDLRVVGGLYKGYVRVADFGSYDIFAKWTSAGDDISLVYIMHDTWNWSNADQTKTVNLLNGD